MVNVVGQHWPGYHPDDWESVQFRLRPDGEVDQRASSHHGYNYVRGVGNWGSDAGVVSRVHLRSASAMPMPVELDLRLEDGTTRHLSLPVEIWYGGSQYALIVPGPKRVVGATIDARNRYPDVRRENNSWMASATGGTTGRSGNSGTH